MKKFQICQDWAVVHSFEAEDRAVAREIAEKWFFDGSHRGVSFDLMEVVYVGTMSPMIEWSDNTRVGE